MNFDADQNTVSGPVRSSSPIPSKATKSAQRASGQLLGIRGRTFRWRPPGCDAAAHPMDGGLWVATRRDPRGLFDLRPLRLSWLQPRLQLTEDIVQTQSPLLRLPDRAPPMVVSVGGGESVALRQPTGENLYA